MIMADAHLHVGADLPTSEIHERLLWGRLQSLAIIYPMTEFGA